MRRSRISIVFIIAFIGLAAMLLLPSDGATQDAPLSKNLQASDPTPTPEPTVPPPRPVRVRFSGHIEVLSTELPGEWVVGGVSVTVTAGTVVVPANDGAKVGDWARIKATRHYDGALVANHIRYQDGSNVGAHPVEFKGLIQEVTESSLTVSDVLVQIDAQTKLVGVPITGFLAEVKGFLQPDSSVLALRIEVSDPSEIGTEFEGEIEAFPLSPYVGQWLVDGVPVLAIEGATEILGLLDPQLGLFAEVTGVLAPDGVVRAKTIKVVNPTENSIEGIVGKLGESEWVIGGIAVGVDGNTLIDESRARAATGMQAEATVIDQGNGTLLAIRIRLERPW